jgi:hypothetical protein
MDDCRPLCPVFRAFWRRCRLFRDNHTSRLPRISVLVRSRHTTFVPRKVEPYLRNLYGPSKYWHDRGPQCVSYPSGNRGVVDTINPSWHQVLSGRVGSQVHVTAVLSRCSHFQLTDAKSLACPMAAIPIPGTAETFSSAATIHQWKASSRRPIQITAYYGAQFQPEIAGGPVDTM